MHIGTVEWVMIGATLLLALTSVPLVFWPCLLARMNGVQILPIEILGMRLRSVSVRTVLASAIRLHKAGIRQSTNQLETHQLAGGDLPRVTSALITAKSRGIPLQWNIAAAIDLAGRDVLALIARAAADERLRWPAEPGAWGEAVAADKGRVRLRFEAVVRLNLERVVGGGDLDMTLDHMSAAINGAIATCPTPADAATSADRIAKAVLKPGVLPITAFDLLSLRIRIEA